MSNHDERDSQQRTVGFIGFSMISHIGLLAALLVMPKAQLEPFGLASGDGGDSSVIVDLQSPGSNAAESTTAVLAAQPAPKRESEPLLVDKKDPEAIPLPTKAEPVEKPVVKVQKPKVAPKRVAKAKEPVAREDGDQEVKAALIAARQAPQDAPQETEETPLTEPQTESIQTEQTQEVAPVLEPEQQTAHDEVAEEREAQLAEPEQMSPTAVASTAETSNERQDAGSARRAGGGAGYGVPLGVQIRDARELMERAGNRPPTYPQQDRLRGREGVTVIVARIRPDGGVAEVALERSSGSPYMDQASLQAFKNWKFMPGQEGYVRKAFQFSLRGEAKELPARLRR